MKEFVVTMRLLLTDDVAYRDVLITKLKLIVYVLQKAKLA